MRLTNKWVEKIAPRTNESAGGPGREESNRKRRRTRESAGSLTRASESARAQGRAEVWQENWRPRESTRGPRRLGKELKSEG